MGRSASVDGQCKHYTKKCLPNFPTPKSPGIELFKPKETSFGHPCHLKSGVPAIPLLQALTIAVYSCLNNCTKFYHYYQFIILKALSPSTLQAIVAINH